mgnify:FL=1
MNKKIILLFIVIAILFVLGGIFCLKKNTQTPPIQSNKAILWDCDSNDKILLSEMADTFSLLPLETIDRSLMGEISKLVFSGDSFYVLDRNYMSAIFSFNTQTGKFIEKIGVIGNGPGEYNRIYDFSIDEKNQVIYVLGNKEKIMTYTLSGEFKTEKKLPFYATALEAFDDKFCFVCEDEERNNLIVTDKDLHIISSYFPNKQYGNNLRILIHPFQKTDSGVFYRRFLDNNIYKIDQQGNLSLAYQIHLGTNTLGINDIKSLTEKEVKEKLKTHRCHIKYFTENNQYAIIVFHDKNKPYISVYNKQSGKTKTSPLESQIDNLLGKKYILPEYVSAKNDFVVIIQPEEINELTSETDSTRLSEDVNPILYILQMKKQI